jgi:hypothetical protein
MMATTPDKPLMRCLGEFVGHIVNAVKSNPPKNIHELNRSVEERADDQVTLRRTTIEEIEIHSEETNV